MNSAYGKQWKITLWIEKELLLTATSGKIWMGSREASRPNFHSQKRKEEHFIQSTAWAKEEREREKLEYIWITPNISVWQEPKAGEEHNPLFKILSIKFNKRILKYWFKDYCLLSNVLILGATVGVQGKLYSKQGRKIKLLASILLPGASLHSTLI